jgi:DNA-binding LacI/PurR family transcriptional regulator
MVARKGHIARHEQQAIIDAARELNYTPNAVAVSLRNRRTRTIGVLTWSSPSGFWQLASRLVPQLTTIERPNRPWPSRP